MVRTPVEKDDSMQENMNSVGREMETLRLKSKF